MLPGTTDKTKIVCRASQALMRLNITTDTATLPARTLAADCAFISWQLFRPRHQSSVGCEKNVPRASRSIVFRIEILAEETHDIRQPETPRFLAVERRGQC